MNNKSNNSNNSINSKRFDKTYAPIKKRLDDININNVCTISGGCILATHERMELSRILRSIKC